MDGKHIGLKVPADIADWIDQEAARLMCSRAVVVRQILARSVTADAQALAFSRRLQDGNAATEGES